MRIRSSKRKGARGVKELREAILKAFPELEEEDITLVPGSMRGEDLKLSPKARKCWPFATEVKNKESLNIWAAITQSVSNAKGRPPAVAFRRNRQPMWTAVPLEVMLELLQSHRKDTGFTSSGE
jgi:hypothetical protein